MQKRDIPLFNVPVGPGSQPEEDLVLDYMPMPREMDTYFPPVLPEAEELQACPHAVKLLERLQALLERYRCGEPGIQLNLNELPEADLELINQVLGEGEVSLIIEGDAKVRAQETVLAGVWRLREFNTGGEMVSDLLEVADLPQPVKQRAFRDAVPLKVDADKLSAELLNVPSVLVELADATGAFRPEQVSTPHVINLSLLPFSPADHQCLEAHIGRGPVTILSRGYGNCRISCCAVNALWRVQYFNSTDQLILDTLEVTDVPEVACAAQEDLEDSAMRLHEIREVLI